MKIGDEMDLLIMRTNDQEGTIMLSKKRLDAIKGWEEIVEANENETVVTGIVTEVIKGGVIAVTPMAFALFHSRLSGYRFQRRFFGGPSEAGSEIPYY